MTDLAPDFNQAEKVIYPKWNRWIVAIDAQPSLRGFKQGYRKLAVYRNSRGEIYARIFEIIPDVIYLESHRRATTLDFTGRLFIFDENYHLISGAVYDQGKQIGKIRPRQRDTTVTENHLMGRDTVYNQGKNAANHHCSRL